MTTEPGRRWVRLLSHDAYRDQLGIYADVSAVELYRRVFKALARRLSPANLDLTLTQIARKKPRLHPWKIAR
jgi:hypothetical protein